MLAARHDFLDDLPAQIGGREGRHPEVGPPEDIPGQRVVEADRGREHGVALSHPDIIRNLSTDGEWAGEPERRIPSPFISRTAPVPRTSVPVP